MHLYSRVIHLYGTPIFIDYENLCTNQLLTEKKCTMWELWVKFYWGQNEDYSPGDSILDSSEKLLQRGRGEGQYICDFGEGDVHAIKHIFFAEVCC